MTNSAAQRTDRPYRNVRHISSQKSSRGDLPVNGRHSVSVSPLHRVEPGPSCVPVALVGQVGARESTSDNQLRVVPVDCLLPPAARGTLGPVILDPAVYTRLPPPAPPSPMPDRAATETRTYIAWANSPPSSCTLFSFAQSTIFRQTDVPLAHPTLLPPYRIEYSNAYFYISRIE